MAAPGAERVHPQPAHLLAFAERQAASIGRAYVARLAEFIRREYPGSAAELLPKLRAIYRAAQ